MSVGGFGSGRGSYSDGGRRITFSLGMRHTILPGVLKSLLLKIRRWGGGQSTNVRTEGLPPKLLNTRCEPCGPKGVLKSPVGVTLGVWGKCQGLTYNRMNRCAPPWPKAITRMGRKGSGDTFRLSRRNLRNSKPYEIYTQPDGLFCNAASTCEESYFGRAWIECLPSIRPSQDPGLNFRDGQEFVVHYVLV